MYMFASAIVPKFIIILAVIYYIILAIFIIRGCIIYNVFIYSFHENIADIIIDIIIDIPSVIF